MTKLIYLSAILAVTAAATAADLNVPAHYTTIQEAIDIAVDGDTVIIADGTHTGPGNYNCLILGKNITIKSQNGPANCIIDCQGTSEDRRRAFGTTSEVTIDGFTITNSFGGSSKAISTGQGANLSIKNCILTSQQTYVYDDAPFINISNSSATIENCRIDGNSTGANGINVSYSTLTINNSIITKCDYGIYSGGSDSSLWAVSCHIFDNSNRGIRTSGDASITNCIVEQNSEGLSVGGLANIQNCTVINNRPSSYGFGIYTGSGVVANCIVYGNAGDSFIGNVSITNCCFPEAVGTNGNISGDPAFLSSNTVALAPDSPCIDAGTSEPPAELPTTDYYGNQRNIDGNKDSSSQPDIGAYEFDPDTPTLILQKEPIIFCAVQGTLADPQTIELTRAGGTTLNWAASSPRVTVIPQSSTITGISENASIILDTTDMAAGIHQVELVFTSDNAINSPQKVTLIAYVGNLINVPQDYPTIQEAIDNSINGSTIVVAPGIYLESRIQYKGKAITLRSTDPTDWNVVKSTVIDAEFNSSCFVFDAREDRHSILEGFTITHGRGGGSLGFALSSCEHFNYNYPGGGILCYYTSPTIRYCNITRNGLELSRFTSDVGAGIAIIGDSNATVSNCFITNNYSSYQAGGVFVSSCRGNELESKPIFTNCTIAYNDTDSGGRSFQAYIKNSNTTLENCIIHGSSSEDVILNDLSQLSYCCTRMVSDYDGNIIDHTATSNISGDPMFLKPIQSLYPEIEGDYHLMFDSPCINAGNPLDLLTDSTDIDGNQRVIAGRIDIGADEVVPRITVSNIDSYTIWASGSTHNIKWQSHIFTGNVDVLFSDDTGSTWQTIAEDIANTGSMSWLVPETIDSDQCVIKVMASDYDEPIEYVDSGIFSIHPSPPDSPINSPWQTLGRGSDRTAQASAVAPELGCVKWSYNTQGQINQSVTIGANNNIHIPCQDGILYTIDPNGTGVWTYDAGSEITSSPTVGPDGTVYFGTRNGRLHAVDKNGSARWTHSTDAMIFATPAVDTDGNVFVGSQNGSVYAFASDGSDLWSFATQGPGQLPGAVLASPSIGPDGTVYIGGLYDPTLYALNPNNGTIKWTASFPEGTGFFVSPVIADDGTIYVSLIDSANLYAIDPVDGQLIDTIDLLDIPAITDPATSEDYLDKFPDAQCFTEPAIATDGTIYISLSDPYLRAINPDGSLKWATRLGMAGGFTLAVGNDGLIYAASDDRTLYVVSPDGQLLSVFTGDRFLSFPVIAADGTIYLSDADNTVWAIGTLPCDEDKVNLHRIEDLSADGIVNLVDLSLLAADWLACNEPGYQAGCNYNGIEPRYLTGDIDRDIYVNFEDLQMMAINWLNAD